MPKICHLVAVALLSVGAPAVAQPVSSPIVAPVPAEVHPAAPVVMAAPDAPVPACELHIRPTRNFIAINTGLLVGLGALGGALDYAVHADRVKSVREQMADALTADAQIAQLKQVDAARLLKMPEGTAIIVDEPFPSWEQIKKDEAIKARMKGLESDEKAGKRFTTSTAPCYAELIAVDVFYQKAAMYGTRVFTNFFFRDFRDGLTVAKVSKGQVETHTPDFPAETPDKVEAAKLALLDSYGKDLIKWVGIKLKP